MTFSTCPSSFNVASTLQDGKTGRVNISTTVTDTTTTTTTTDADAAAAVGCLMKTHMLSALIVMTPSSSSGSGLHDRRKS